VLVSEADPEVAIAALRDAGYLAAGEEADGTLSIRRPKSLRAPAGLWRAWDEDGDYDFEPEDLDILEDLDSERIEDLFGESSPVVLAAIARRRSQELGASSQRGPRHDAAEPAGAQALRDLVTRLRRGPAVADADGEPGGGSKGTGARPAGAGLGADALGADALGAGALGRLPLDLGLGTADAASGYLRPWGASGAARPSQIAKGVAGVTNLLESAIDHEWAVRLCWRDEEAPTYTREAYILPIELRRGFFDAELVDGEPLSIPTSQLVWARVLTEAEEEANVLMGEPY
jgi:hypothetical protein